MTCCVIKQRAVYYSLVLQDEIDTHKEGGLAGNSLWKAISNLSVSEGVVLLVDHPELWSQKTQSSTYIFFSKNTGESREGRKMCISTGYLSFLVPEGNWGNKFLAQSVSHVQLFVTPWTIARQAPLSMGFPRQECWNGLPSPPPGDLFGPGIEPVSPVSPALPADSLLA